MLSDLKFVNGAVAKKDLIEGMTHFAIESGNIRAYNGTLALSSPIAFDIDCKPNAKQLIAAISKCNDEHTVVISMTDGGRLRIQNGPFRAFVETIEEETPHVLPEGESIDLAGTNIREGLNSILPFVSTDASRPWTNGVLFSGRSMLATNNVCVVEYWLGKELPFTANVPREAVMELKRVGEEPSYAQLNQNSITFHFPSGRWIRSQLYEKWTVDVAGVLNVEDSATDIDPKIFEGLEAISPFVDKMNNVFFRAGAMQTSLDDNIGAKFELEDFDGHGCYSLPMLQLLKGVAEKIDWTLNPKPAIFYGSGSMLRGAIIGRYVQGEGE